MKPTSILISAPFTPISVPSISLTLLKGIAERFDYPVSIKYLGIDFVKNINIQLYHYLAVGYPTNTTLAGEFLFSSHFYSRPQLQVDEFIKRYLATPPKNDVLTRIASSSLNKDAAYNHKQFLSDYCEALLRVPEWITHIVQQLAGIDGDIYGFTSTFQQTVASLSIAQHLKKLKPNALIIFGGSNCESPMGDALLREYPFIDMVCSGEGEDAFLSVLRYVENQGTTPVHRNILCQKEITRQMSTQTGIDPPIKMDTLPNLDYDDYFSQLSAIKDITPRLLIQLSRGCWWGQKSHCTFCGLNGQSIQFRAKSGQKALSDLVNMNRKYPSMPISVVDNVMDHHFFKTLFEQLSHENLNVELFFETRAKLTREQLKLMRLAGITRIQPGIESLSTHVLKLMNKGVKAIHNVCLLKYCVECGVKPEWNILWGFPGENPNDYDKINS